MPQSIRQIDAAREDVEVASYLTQQSSSLQKDTAAVPTLGSSGSATNQHELSKITEPAQAQR